MGFEGQANYLTDIEFDRVAIVQFLVRGLGTQGILESFERYLLWQRHDTLAVLRNVTQMVKHFCFRVKKLSVHSAS